MKKELTDKDKFWRVVYTKAKHERAVASELTAKGVEVYLPLKREIHQWSDRKKVIEVPLFKSYVFVRYNSDSSEQIIRSVDGIVDFVRVANVIALVPEREVKAIQKFLKYSDHNSISISTHVEIISGPFKGATGIVDHITVNKARVIINSLNIVLVAEKLSLKAL